MADNLIKHEREDRDKMSNQRHSHKNSESEHSQDHSHGASRTSSRKLALVSLINLLGFVAELAGGLLFGSVALISDAVHMLFDALAYVMAFVASYIANNYNESDEWSYGLHRLEPLAAFLNGLLLLPMVGFILWESYQRFLQPIDIGTGPTLLIATGGLFINLGSVYVLQGGEMSLNERGAFYHLIGDAGGSIAVIVSTLIIEVTGIRIVDPLTAALIAMIVTWSAIKVLRGSSAIFLHKTPLDLDELRATIIDIDGVDSVNDIHAWQICSQITMATLHIETSAELMTEAETVNKQVHEILNQYDVDHATVELSSSFENREIQLDTHTH